MPDLFFCFTGGYVQPPLKGLPLTYTVAVSKANETYAKREIPENRISINMI